MPKPLSGSFQSGVGNQIGIVSIEGFEYTGRPPSAGIAQLVEQRIRNA
jgi:hypothetical protein